MNKIVGKINFIMLYLISPHFIFICFFFSIILCACQTNINRQIGWGKEESRQTHTERMRRWLRENNASMFKSWLCTHIRTIYSISEFTFLGAWTEHCSPFFINSSSSSQRNASHSIENIYSTSSFIISLSSLLFCFPRNCIYLYKREEYACRAHASALDGDQWANKAIK